MRGTRGTSVTAPKGHKMSNNLALLVVSSAELEGVPAQAQTLLIGTDTEVIGYHRVSNGMKGRGQSWQRLSDSTIPTAPITHEPCAVVVSDRDVDMMKLGQITNIGIKALYALESAPEVTAPQAHNEAVDSLINRLEEGDNTLANLITDKRRTNGVSINPIIKGAVTTSATVTEVAEVATKVMNIPVSNESNALVTAMVSVPDKRWAKEYINRKIINSISDFDTYDYALSNGMNILIEGHAGSGKTASVQAYASARNMRYFNVACHIGLEASHLIGRWIPTPEGHFRWQDGAVTEIVRNGGVLLFNEINFAPERFLTFIFSLLDYRREIQLMENGGEVIHAHKDLIILADMNPDYRGTRPLNQALADRFSIRLQFPYDKVIEQKLLGSNALITMANQLRDEFNKGTLVTPVSTRSLVAFIKNAKQFGMDFATYNYVNSFEGDEERSSVRLVITTHRDNIAQDLGLPLSNKASVHGNSNVETALLNTEVGTQVEAMEVATAYALPDMNDTQGDPITTEPAIEQETFNNALTEALMDFTQQVGNQA